MRSSSTDPVAPGRGTWVRLGLVLVLVALLLVPSGADLTQALLTDSVGTTTVVSTAPTFPPRS